MGPAGAVLFVVVVMLSEMIPLFPTQPLSLASGLLFGGKQVSQRSVCCSAARGFGVFCIPTCIRLPTGLRSPMHAGFSSCTDRGGPPGP